jgi:hypothetical protein
MKYLNYGLAVCALVAAGVLGTSAKADLIYTGPVTIGGAGLGNVSTILTMNGHGSSDVESGMVSWNGTKDVVTPDPNPPGYTPSGSTDMTGINNTILMSETGWKHGDGLEIIFNPAEPQNAQKISITLNNLVMTIYDSATGATKFQAPWLDGPLTLDAVDPGTGNAGYGFALNAIETTELNLAVNNVQGSDHIGLLAFATDAQGGNETFFGTVIAHDPDPVPAPGNTLGLLGIGPLVQSAGVVVVRTAIQLQ